jgi:DNA polymerase III delta subunit
VQYAGPSLLDLQNEIEKVALRYSARKRVGEPEIASTVGRYRQETVWAINHEFRPDNMAGFLNALSRVLETEAEPIGVGAVLAWHVKTVLRVKLLQEKGVRSDQMFMKGVRVKADAWPHLERQAGAFKKKQLALWLRNLQRADAQMKSVKLPPRWVFERALVNSFLGQELS